MDNEKVTIVVPVYNVEKYLNKCIDSILSQTYENSELILVDDGSSDNSGTICEEYAKKDKRIKVIHKENAGLSDARNKGIDVATGKYITFVDSDDFIKSDYIEVLYKLLKKYDADIAIGDCEVINENKIQKSEQAKITEYVLTSKESISKMLYSDFYFVSAWAKLYKMELFENIRFPEGKLFEDVGTTHKLILKSKNIACTNEKIYFYIIRNNSITTSKFKKEHLDLIQMTENMCDNIIKVYPEMQKMTLRRKVYANISTLNRMLLSQENAMEDEKKKILQYIKQNGKAVLKDKKVGIRDKVAIFLINFNLKIYKIFLKLYKK